MRKRIGNIYNRLEKLELEAKSDLESISFTDGTEIVALERAREAMFDSVIAGNPDKLALFYLNKLKEGHEDEWGLVHLLDAYNIGSDPERLAALWRDHDEQ